MVTKSKFSPEVEARKICGLWKAQYGKSGNRDFTIDLRSNTIQKMQDFSDELGPSLERNFNEIKFIYRDFLDFAPKFQDFGFPYNNIPVSTAILKKGDSGVSPVIISIFCSPISS